MISINSNLSGLNQLIISLYCTSEVPVTSHSKTHINVKDVKSKSKVKFDKLTYAVGDGASVNEMYRII